MTEAEQAVRLAHIVLDRRNADPDDDFAVLARQLLRALDRESALFAQGAEQMRENAAEKLSDMLDPEGPLNIDSEAIRTMPLPQRAQDWLERKLAAAEEKAYRRCADNLRPEPDALMEYDGDNHGDTDTAASNRTAKWYAEHFDKWAVEAASRASGETPALSRTEGADGL